MPDPFISRQDLTDYLGRDVTADAGALIAVEAASDAVRTISEQDFLPASETVLLDGTGTDTLLLPQLPVRAAGTVVVNGGTLSSTLDYKATEGGHLIRTGGTAAHSSWPEGSGPNSYWPSGRQNVRVTYDYGYLSGTVTDVPADVRLVALSMAHRLVTQGGATEESVGTVRKKYAAAATDFTAGELRILRKHRPS